MDVCWMMWFVIDFAPDEPVPLYQIVPKKNKNKKHISSYDGLHVLNNHITILPNNPAGLWGVVLGQILAVIQIIHFHHKVISVQSVSWKTLALHRLVYKNEEKKQTNKQTAKRGQLTIKPTCAHSNPPPPLPFFLLLY